MTLLTGLTADGTEVPVQVKPDGTLIAEGLEGPPGADGSDATNYWTKNGSDLYYDSGRLLVGTSSARANFNNSIDTSPIQVEGLSAYTSGAAFIHSGANNLPSVLVFAKQRSGAVGGNTIVQNDDFTGFISFEGNDGAHFVRCASIAAYVDDNPGADDMPGRLIFSTTANGSSSPTERMRIDSAGNVGIGTTQPSRALDVMGAVGATDGYYLRSPNGTWWQLTVDDTGALATTAAPVVKANDLYSRTRGNLAP